MAIVMMALQRLSGLKYVKYSERHLLHNKCYSLFHIIEDNTKDNGNTTYSHLFVLSSAGLGYRTDEHHCWQIMKSKTSLHKSSKDP